MNLQTAERILPRLPHPSAAPEPINRRLICLPHSGSGRTGYRPWPALLPADTQVRVWVPAGREHRIDEAPCADPDRAVTELAHALLSLDPLPYTLFGHSMGAMAAFALTVRLAAHGGPLPHRLLLSGADAPGAARRPELHRGSDQDLVDWLGRLGATPAELLRDPIALRLFLPAIRADLAVAAGCAAAGRHAPPVPVPLLALRGAEDATTTAAGTERWRRHTTAGMRHVTLPGGHFFPQEQTAALLGLVRAALPPAISTVSPVPAALAAPAARREPAATA